MGRQWLAAVLAVASMSFARVEAWDGFDGEYAQACKQVATKLAEFAQWCGTSKLYLERDKALEALLRFEPADADAHRTLKHSQQRDGSWSVPEKKTEAKNFNPTKLEECSKKRAELVAEFRVQALAMLEAHAKDAPPGTRQRVLDDLIAIDSEDAETRGLRGEVRRDTEWVLKETVTGKERRAAIKELVTKSVAAVAAPQTIEPSSQEQALGVAWTACVATPKVRVISSGSIDEARKVAVMCRATADVFRSLTGASNDLPDGFTVYILTSQGARDAFIAGWPGWTAEERARMKTWAGTGVPGDVHHARWDADAPRRLDGAVRHVIGLLTLLEYGYDHQSCAWAWEGVGLYLARELVGTRYTWYSTGPTSGDAESKELLGKLMMTDVNWMNECYQRAKRGKMPTLEKLCSRKIDQLGVDDVLTSYAFSAYVIEGRPDKLGEVMRRIAREGSAKALSAALQSDLPGLDQKLVRWLSERK